MEPNRLNTAGNTTGNGDSEKHMVVVLAIIVSSENSSPSCDFFDRCYCMVLVIGSFCRFMLSIYEYIRLDTFGEKFIWFDLVSHKEHVYQVSSIFD